MIGSDRGLTPHTTAESCTNIHELSVPQTNQQKSLENCRENLKHNTKFVEQISMYTTFKFNLYINLNMYNLYLIIKI